MAISWDQPHEGNMFEFLWKRRAEYGLQYVLTAIEDDLPRDENDKNVEFGADEIIRELHDQGDDGRLFRMPRF